MTSFSLLSSRYISSSCISFSRGKITRTSTHINTTLTKVGKLCRVFVFAVAPFCVCLHLHLSHQSRFEAEFLNWKPIADKEPVTCCDDNGQLTADAASNEVCAPILVPPHDPTHSAQGTQCFNFVRTGTTRDRGCTPPNAPAEPVN